jgi:beta-aspartyl-peptidase (threonine type)
MDGNKMSTGIPRIFLMEAYQVEIARLTTYGTNFFLLSGAVMAVRRFINPVKLARKVMDDGVHCALSGDGALEFAREINFPICNPKELKEKNPNQKLDINNQDYQDYVHYRYAGEPLQESWSRDTVSAVAMDDNGHLACATSSGKPHALNVIFAKIEKTTRTTTKVTSTTLITLINPTALLQQRVQHYSFLSSGGIAGKRKGRVGDVPLVGCGGYANKHGAATTTGHGESIMKMTLARDVVYRMENAERIAQHNPDLNAELNVQVINSEPIPFNRNQPFLVPIQ